MCDACICVRVCVCVCVGGGVSDALTENEPYRRTLQGYSTTGPRFPSILKTDSWDLYPEYVIK